jgi:hypothetical protein
VLDVCWFGGKELCGELGEDGFIIYVDNKGVLDIEVEVSRRELKLKLEMGRGGELKAVWLWAGGTRLPELI